MDGIHIVAFAEEADPGEGGRLDELGGLVEGGDGVFWEAFLGECKWPGLDMWRCGR